ncbi:hypothetical protein ACFR9U_00515 [Halorientalis brevis]|uniref:Uncharacterized protein n=1 Tax=Halorientalis brevis TaxID=1126241 RepID=A0ABD6C586_9EURY|nr:hypothetical protein [Halorientalis brevis]
MDDQRRLFLRALGAGLGLGSAGCLTRGPTERTPDAEVVTTRAVTDQPVEETPETVTTEPSEPDVDEQAEVTEAEARLAETTDRIMDELAWFATEYPNAIEAYKEAGDEVTSAVSEVGETVPLTEQDVRRLDGEIDRPQMDQGWPWNIWWEKGEKRWRRIDVDWQEPSEDQSDETPLAASDVERLRDETQAFADTFEAEFDPHFTGGKKERQFSKNTIDVIKRFNDLGDRAMVVAGLVRLFEHYEAVVSAAYVQKNLSNDPIQNRLADYMVSDADTIPAPPLFEVEYHQGQLGHTAFVNQQSVGTERTEALYQAKPTATIDGSNLESGQLRLQDVVEELEVGTSRVDRCYCIVSAWVDLDEKYYSSELPSQSVFVQRYRDADAAGTAHERLLDRDGVSRIDGTEIVLGDGDGTTWEPIIFPFRSESWYALSKRSGRNLLIAAVSRRPFEHRDGESEGSLLQRVLGLSWLRSAPDFD